MTRTMTSAPLSGKIRMMADAGTSYRNTRSADLHVAPNSLLKGQRESRHPRKLNIFRRQCHVTLWGCRASHLNAIS